MELVLSQRVCITLLRYHVTMVEVETSGLHCNFCFKAITYFVRSEVKLHVNLYVGIAVLPQ